MSAAQPARESHPPTDPVAAPAAARALDPLAAAHALDPLDPLPEVAARQRGAPPVGERRGAAPALDGRAVDGHPADTPSADQPDADARPADAHAADPPPSAARPAHRRASARAMPGGEPAALRLARAARGVRGHPALAERAALHLLDWLGNAACGAAGDSGRRFARWLALQAAGPVPTLAGCRADAAAAAAFHGALGSTLEMDDVHRSSILHPGPVVIPAALAAALATPQVDGARLLQAIGAGYEAMIRVGRALGPSHYRRWHSTGTAGSFGAAAAAAALFDLDETASAQALALAGTRAGGLWQVRHESSHGKLWHMAGAARDGLGAAQLAACGLTGPLGVLDGESGWYAATAPGANDRCIDEARAEPWLFDVSFKPWPACRHAHPAIDALRSAAAGRALDAAAIAGIEVRTYADALRFCDRPRPQDETQARFSIQHALAAWVVHGQAQLAHYQRAAIEDATLGALRARVRVQRDAAIDARYPAQYGARVAIRWRDGSRSEAELADTYGDPARPMSVAAIEAKARTLMQAAGWDGARIDAAVAACAALPRAPDLGALARVIAP